MKTLQVNKILLVEPETAESHLDVKLWSNFKLKDSTIIVNTTG
jgi:hypothetical protein